jgi:hypothetical protein
MLTLYTFGDSILDCARYNELGVHPGQLLVQNDDRLFPEFQVKIYTLVGKPASYTVPVMVQPLRVFSRRRRDCTLKGVALR